MYNTYYGTAKLQYGNTGEVMKCGTALALRAGKCRKLVRIILLFIKLDTKLWNKFYILRGGSRRLPLRTRLSLPRVMAVINQHLPFLSFTKTSFKCAYFSPRIREL